MTTSHDTGTETDALAALRRAKAGIVGKLSESEEVYCRTIGGAEFSIDTDGRLIILESPGKNGGCSMSELTPQDTLALLRFAEPFIRAGILATQERVPPG